MMETELELNVNPFLKLTLPPIKNGWITKEDDGKRGKLELIKRLSEKTQSTEGTFEAEIERYLTHQLTDAEIMSFDILDWW